MNARKFCWLGCLVAAGLVSEPLAAQTTEQEARCAAAVRELPDARGEAWAQALGDLRRCGDTTVAVFARLWERPPATRQELRLLAWLSRETGDPRVFQAARRTSIDTTMPRVARLEALAAMITIVDPSMVVETEGLDQDPSSGQWMGRLPLIGLITDQPPRSPAEIEISRRLGPQVISTLVELTSNDADRRLQFAAKHLLLQLEGAQWFGRR